jgi:hypothetical protein
VITLTYDQQRFPLASTVAELIGVFDMTRLRTRDSIVTRQTDQDTAWHATFYRAFPRMRELYDDFVAHVSADLVEAPFAFQAVPTFRIQPPRNYAVGEFHRDADYNHPDGEVNFWVPLTPVYSSSAVWIEPSPGAAPEPFPAQPGEVLVFDAVNQRHGNVINSSGHTRVSFDFRCLPLSRLVESDLATLNTGMRFRVGEYYTLGDAR